MTALFEIATVLAWAMLGLAFAIGLTRLVVGPHLPDRIVALDMLALIGICAACVHALTTGATGFLDLALVMALVSFLSTVAFARYVEWVAFRRSAQENPPPLDHADD
jgi:multicomponent Na+:H+ antiporter subunit F